MLRPPVVVPTHGTHELTLRCVDALNAGGPGSSEVDDGSTDGTGEALRDRHPVVKVLSLAPARGFTAAANLGMGQAVGEFLFLLNSDTEVEPTVVERLLHAFDAASRTGAPSGAPAMRPRGCGCSR